MESVARFPDEVVVALHEAGVTLGCLPVRVDDEDWQAALFYVVPPDAPCLRTSAPSAPVGAEREPSSGSEIGHSGPSDSGARSPGHGGVQSLHGAPFAVALELELHEHAAATVIELGVEIRTPGAPLAGSVLFLTGHSSAHFDALTLLAGQADLPVFIGDEYCRLLASQRVPLGDGERRAFRSLLDEAVGRDAVIRLSSRYDPVTAFDDVLKRGGGQRTSVGADGAPDALLPRRGPPPGPNGNAGR